MLVGALISVIAMLHHPEGATENAAQISKMRWVHGGLIFLLIFNAFGFGRLTENLSSTGRDMKFCILFYNIGLSAFIGGALVSGFVQTTLVETYSTETKLFSSFNTYSYILNQALAKLGVLSFGASAVSIAPALVAGKGLTRLVGLASVVVGATLIAPMLAGLQLTVTIMTLLTVSISVWHSMIALWLLNT